MCARTTGQQQQQQGGEAGPAGEGAAAEDASANVPAGPNPGAEQAPEEADTEMEAEIVDATRGGAADPLAAYDVSVADEGAALEEYLAMLETAGDAA